MTATQTPWAACVNELAAASDPAQQFKTLAQFNAEVLQNMGVSNAYFLSPWHPVNQGMPPESQKVVFLWHGMEIEGCWTQSANGKSRIRWHIGRESFSGGSDESPTHWRIKSPPPHKLNGSKS